MDDKLKQLINGLKNKDLKAYEELFFLYHGRLVLFALKFTGDLQIAQDIVQDAFLILWEKAGTISISSSPKSYLFQAVRNSCLNYKRHISIQNSAKNEIRQKIEYFEKSAYFDFNDPYYSLLELELEQKIEEVVNSMPEKCHEVFKLSRHQHLQNKEIAEKLGISVKAVEKHISKALMILRRDLAEYLGALLVLTFKNFQ